jgi:hypothetical protein
MVSSSTAMATSLLGNPISVKLTKANYTVWKAQILAVLRGARFEGYVTGAIKAPPEKIKDKEDMILNPAYKECTPSTSKCWCIFCSPCLGRSWAKLQSTLLPPLLGASSRACTPWGHVQDASTPAWLSPS